MNYSAASYGVSKTKTLNAPRGGELNPCPPKAALPASGGIKLGEVGIVDKSFADSQLKSMAGYRNRLTHFYADITPEEIHAIIKENLVDFDTFLIAIKRVLSHPSEFGLIVE